MPKQRPVHVDPNVYDQLKSGIFKEYMGWGGVMKVPEQIISTAFNKLYDKEILLLRDPKEINNAKK